VGSSLAPQGVTAFVPREASMWTDDALSDATSAAAAAAAPPVAAVASSHAGEGAFILTPCAAKLGSKHTVATIANTPPLM
jgi:hypothetical protein